MHNNASIAIAKAPATRQKGISKREVRVSSDKEQTAFIFVHKIENISNSYIILNDEIYCNPLKNLFDSDFREV
jgi:hypothetical protein